MTIQYRRYIVSYEDEETNCDPVLLLQVPLLVHSSPKTEVLWTMQEPVLVDDLRTKPKEGWGYIYLITSPSGKQYVGQTRTQLSDRISKHRSSPDCVAIYNAFKVYGEAMSVVIIECCPICRLNDAEIEHISRLGSLSPGGYNLLGGGLGRIETSDITRKRIGDAGRGRWGHPMSEKTRLALLAARLGSVTSEETKSKISVANKGRQMSETTKQRMSAAQLGHSVSEETKSRIRASKVGRPMSEEARRIRRARPLGFKHSEASKIKMRIGKLQYWKQRKEQMDENTTIEAQCLGSMPEV